MDIVITVPDGYEHLLNDYDCGSIVDRTIRKAIRFALNNQRFHSRLIDANMLKKELEEYGFEEVTNADGMKLTQLIDEQPTLYETGVGR